MYELECGLWNMERLSEHAPVFQLVLQTVEFTGGFLANLLPSKTCFGKPGTACDTVRGVLGSCAAAELQVSLSFPSMIDCSFFEEIKSAQKNPTGFLRWE